MTMTTSSNSSTIVDNVQQTIDSINDKLAQSGTKPLTLILSSATGSILTLLTLQKLVQWSREHPQGLRGFLFQHALKLLEKTPVIGSKIDATKEEMKMKIKQSLPRIQNDASVVSLPQYGTPAEELLRRLQKIHEQDKLSGKLSGTVYMQRATIATTATVDEKAGEKALSLIHGETEEEKHANLLAVTYAMFMHTNPLHYDVFLSTKKFEAEVVQMTIQLLHGSSQACGAMTSGGTESILMAMKAYRDEARALKPWITHPEIIVPRTAHAAFDKACHYFGIKLVHVEVNQTTFQVEVSQVRRHLNRNTIALVASAPNFPQGTIDPVEELAALAREHKIGLHVDCCLGGFFLPFAAMLDDDDDGISSKIPKFDFSVPGVTSISADTHKYGLSTKGSSVVMFHSKDLRKYMYFLCTAWTGGIYASPSMAGSRSGAQIATCWASMIHMGLDGYLNSTRNIVKAVRTIRNSIERDMSDDLEICGDPVAMVIAFRSSTLNVFQISDRMSHRGWALNALQYPASVHICITPNNAPMAEQFISDLKSSVQEVKTKSVDLKSGMAPMYGLAVSLPDKSIVNELVSEVLDSTLEV